MPLTSIIRTSVSDLVKTLIQCQVQMVGTCRLLELARRNTAQRNDCADTTHGEGFDQEQDDVEGLGRETRRGTLCFWLCGQVAQAPAREDSTIFVSTLSDSEGDMQGTMRWMGEGVRALDHKGYSVPATWTRPSSRTAVSSAIDLPGAAYDSESLTAVLRARPS